MPKQLQQPAQNHVQTIKVTSQNNNKTTSNGSPNSSISLSQQQLQNPIDGAVTTKCIMNAKLMNLMLHEMGKDKG